MKIAVLANTYRIEQVFSKKHLDTLADMGELVLNSGEGGPDELKARELIKDADIAVTSWDCPPLTGQVLENSPALKMVFHAAGSVKGIVTDELWDRGVRVSSAVDELARGVAETTLGLTICSLKNTTYMGEITKAGGWHEYKHTVRDIYGLKIGVIGAGHAGRRYIDLLKNFQVGILLYDPTVDSEECERMGVIKADLETLMSQCDVVSIHAPSIPATRHMINAKNLPLMKDRAILINTARGAIVDEQALIDELKTGRISACIDVTDPEPPAASSELRTLPNVLLTPHIAGNATNGKRRVGDAAVSEIALFIEEKRLKREVFRKDMDIIA